jgi:hypothetical protein
VSTSLVQSAVRRNAKSRFAVIPAGIISKYQLRFPSLTGIDNYRSIKSHHRLPIPASRRHSTAATLLGTLE